MVYCYNIIFCYVTEVKRQKGSDRQCKEAKREMPRTKHTVYTGIKVMNFTSNLIKWSFIQLILLKCILNSLLSKFGCLCPLILYDIDDIVFDYTSYFFCICKKDNKDEGRKRGRILTHFCHNIFWRSLKGNLNQKGKTKISLNKLRNKKKIYTVHFPSFVIIKTYFILNHNFVVKI